MPRQDPRLCPVQRTAEEEAEFLPILGPVWLDGDPLPPAPQPPPIKLKRHKGEKP